jgi:hypothetical protein
MFRHPSGAVPETAGVDRARMYYHPFNAKLKRIKDLGFFKVARAISSDPVNIFRI